ncbi:MAG: hypothetical protein ACK5OX_02255 [Desertimonas sp.]
MASQVLGVDERAVGLKCGWFGGTRAHTIVLVERDRQVLGATVTTSRSPDGSGDAAAREAFGNDMRLGEMHDRIAGDAIRAATTRGQVAAAEL